VREKMYSGLFNLENFWDDARIFHLDSRIRFGPIGRLPKDLCVYVCVFDIGSGRILDRQKYNSYTSRRSNWW
jgi:hypothetical protein